jgi:hypothetical protein
MRHLLRIEYRLVRSGYHRVRRHTVDVARIRSVIRIVRRSRTSESSALHEDVGTNAITALAGARTSRDPRRR